MSFTGKYVLPNGFEFDCTAPEIREWIKENFHIDKITAKPAVLEVLLRNAERHHPSSLPLTFGIPLLADDNQDVDVKIHLIKRVIPQSKLLEKAKEIANLLESRK